MQATIERTTNQGLTRKVYQFNVCLPAGVKVIKVYFDAYRQEARQSRRHRSWTVEERWDRRNRIGYGSTRDVSEPKVPDDVRLELEGLLRMAIVYEF